MATTANIDKTARTAHEMAEAQHDSFEAIAENFAAAQRRTIGIAEGGLEFMRLQEENARAAQEFFANGVRLLQAPAAQRRVRAGLDGVRPSRLCASRPSTTRTPPRPSRGASAGSRRACGLLAGVGWGPTGTFFSPFSYVQEGMRSFQRATQQGLEATEQVARQGLRASEQATRQGLRVAEEATERTEDVMRQTEKVTREAELRTAVLAALKTTDYEGLTVEEVSKRIEGLPTEQP